MSEDNKKKNNKEKKDAKKSKVGVVISDKMDKTVVVKIDRLKVHPIYRKKYNVSKKYKAHDEENKFKVGDRVEIAESKPISKSKNWVVKKLITNSN